MNPDVFITIVFAGFVVLATLVALAVVVPQARRDESQAARRESRRPPRPRRPRARRN